MTIYSYARCMVLATTAGLLLTSTSYADNTQYPERPLQMVVPFSAGGQFDLIARLVASSMSKSLGKEIIIENLGGAGGNIGGAKVAKAKPDGYTLLEYGGNFAVAKYLTKGLRYDPISDFEPIAALSMASHVVLINKDLPVSNFKELVAYSKKNPGKLNYASPGVGTSMHLTFEEIKSHFGIRATHIPYRGGSNALNDLAGGQVQMTIVAVAPAMPFIESGQIRALAVTGSERARSLPEVPTIAEMGYQGFSSGSWAGLVAPKGTPDAVITRLHQAAQDALKDPNVKNRLESLSFTTLAGSREDFKKLIKTEEERYGPLIQRLELQQ